MLNIRLIDYGGGALKGLKDLVDEHTLVVTQADPWAAVSAKVPDLHPEHIVMLNSVYQDELDKLANSAVNIRRVIGVGGGMALDAAKYVSWKTGARLSQVPTIISTNAFATEAIGIRVANGNVKYVGQAFADNVIVDFDLLRDSPRELTLAGIGDVLSCHTATRDWEIAVEDGIKDHPLDAMSIRRARHLVERLADYAGHISQFTDAGLKILLDCNLETVEICQPIGHYRAEEGSEHFLFYTIEHLTRRPYVHGQIVGLGIYIMSKLQNNHSEDIAQLMRDVGVGFSPKDLQLKRETLNDALKLVQKYVRAESLWYSVIDRGIPESFIDEVLQELTF